MSAYPGLGKVLRWAGVALGVPTLGGAVYSGLDAVPILLRPVAGAELLGGIGEGIAVGVFAVSMVALGVAVGLYFLGRRLVTSSGS